MSIDYSKERAMTGKETLLEKALGAKTQLPISHGINNEHYELAVAWVNGIVTGAQVARAIGMVEVDDLGVERINTMKTYARMASWLREAVKRSKIQVRPVVDVDSGALVGLGKGPIS